MASSPAKTCANMDEMQGTPLDDVTQDDFFDLPVVGESEVAQELPVDFMAILDKEDSLMNEVVDEDAAGCAPPTPPAPAPPSPLAPVSTCGSTFGARCMLPGPSRPKCYDLCNHPVGHCGLCACPHHDLDPFADPIIRVVAAPTPTGNGAASSFELVVKDRPTVHNSELTFKSLLAPLTAAGLPLTAMKLHRAGIKNLADAKAMSPPDLVKIGLTEELALQVVEALSPVARAEVKLRSDHPSLAFSVRGSRILADANMPTPELREKALLNLDEACYAASTSSSRETLWETWKHFAKAHWNSPLFL